MAGSHSILPAYQPSYSSRNLDELHRIATKTSTKSDTETSPLHILQIEQSSAMPEARQSQSNSKTYRKLVFTDPVAFRYLEEDESTSVLARRHKLEGYELYVVEQWVMSRTQPTFTICTYTGDLSHSTLVSVLAVPQDQSTWSKRLKTYFNAVSQSYARERETHLGTLMVTNLSGFPSALNVIPVADGDVKKHREDFIVNENLKRMGCTGRAAMSLQYPQASTVTKFHHMYKTSEKTPLYTSVMETVRFCQIALVLYGKLDRIYADGLLCDITEEAISEWWNEIGIDFHNVEPSDGILGPTTVAALIGLMIGAHNRLKEAGAPVGKDPVDLSGMKRAVAHFQKSMKIDRTRRLDRATLDRLHRVTANKAEDEGLGVTRALKSTVAGLSGKGGEMLARGFGGGKEKAGIAEVETLDIERLAQLVTGRSLKWLWQGKDKGLSGTTAPVDELNGRVFSVDEQGNFIWTSEVKGTRDDLDFISMDDPEDRDKRGSRLRDAVGLSSSSKNHSLRTHHAADESSKQGHLAVPTYAKEIMQEPSSQRSSRSNSGEHHPALNLALANGPARTSKPSTTKVAKQGQASERDRRDTNRSAHRHALRGLDRAGRESPTEKAVQQELSNVREELRDARYEGFSTTFRYQQPQAKALRRSMSAMQLRTIQEGRTAKLPRQLSFSLVSDSIHLQRADEEEPPSDSDKQETQLAPSALLKVRKEQLRKSQELGSKVFGLERGIVPFATSRIERVEYIESEAQSQLEELNSVYYQHLEEYQTLQATSTDLVAREKTSLNEAMRSIDMLGQKLDYELDSLSSRMQEVEESVDDFERHVVDIEASVKALVSVEEKEWQPAWYERWLGMGRTQKSASHTRGTSSIDPVLSDPPEDRSC